MLRVWAEKGLLHKGLCEVMLTPDEFQPTSLYSFPGALSLGGCCLVLVCC